MNRPQLYKINLLGNVEVIFQVWARSKKPLLSFSPECQNIKIVHCFLKLGHHDPIFKMQSGNLVGHQHAKPQAKRTKIDQVL